jgi:putative intracellular protease/amidase
MVHRDIKPHNLMLTSDGQIKILDFGLTRVIADRTAEVNRPGTGSNADSATRADMILGTPDYIAPEQIANSSAADIRSDIYSLGCTLYFLLTGRAPFGEGSMVARLHAHEQTAFPKVNEIRPDVPLELVRILSRMTAKRPEERYAEPGHVARDLAALAAEQQNQDLPVAKGATAPGTTRQARRTLIGLAGGALVALLLGWMLKGYLFPAGVTEGADSLRLLVMLPSHGLWYPDYQALVDAAPAADAKLTFAGISEEPSKVVASSPPGVALADVELDAALHADNFEGIVFIGYETDEFSAGGPAGPQTRRLLNDFRRQKKVVASLCAGQRALAQQGALQGKQVAACEHVTREEIAQAGGAQSSQAVVTDGLLVTAADAQDAAALLAAIKKSRDR